MNQIKIGKFIAECRKSKNLTQMQLAETLNITDRAVSKWERGLALPDSSIMLTLCNILGITVNDLLNGEKVDMDNYTSELENKVIELVREKEKNDKMRQGIHAANIRFRIIVVKKFFHENIPFSKFFNENFQLVL